MPRTADIERVLSSRLVAVALGPLLLLLAPPGAADSVRADVVNLSSVRDNTLYEDSTGALSNGSGPTFFAGRSSQSVGSIRRGLIVFDVASIPAGAVITSARLDLHLSQGGSGTRTVSLHRLGADWGEGASNAGSSGGSGAPAAPGDATWIHTFSPSAFWSAPGGDFDPTASAAQAIAGVGFYSWGPTPAMTADVQSWLDGPSSNFGWLLHGDESVGGTSRRFDTREAIDPSFRPVLFVEFTPPPTAALGVTWGRVKSLYR